MVETRVFWPTVEIEEERFKAEENWKRRKILIFSVFDLEVSLKTISFWPIFQPTASKVAFSIGSPTISPSSNLTKAWAEPKTWFVISGTSLGFDKWRIESPNPAKPSKTKSSPVRVPVLSKQQTSILPANGIRNGSVQ